MSAIFLIVGPSGSGKTTLTGVLESRFGYRSIDSYTDRSPRYPGEKGHTFVDSFVEWRSENPDEKLVGYTCYNGHSYWATMAQVDANDLYVLDPAGVEFFRENYYGDKQVKMVYIDAGVRERYARMRGRGDSFWSAVKRLVYDRKAFAGWRDKADFVVRNDDLETAWTSMQEYMKYVG